MSKRVQRSAAKAAMEKIKKIYEEEETVADNDIKEIVEKIVEVNVKDKKAAEKVVKAKQYKLLYADLCRHAGIRDTGRTMCSYGGFVGDDIKAFVPSVTRVFPNIKKGDIIAMAYNNGHLVSGDSLKFIWTGSDIVHARDRWTIMDVYEVGLEYYQGYDLNSLHLRLNKPLEFTNGVAHPKFGNKTYEVIFQNGVDDWSDAYMNALSTEKMVFYDVRSDLLHCRLR